MKYDDFAQTVAARPLVCDGAMGTVIYSHGVHISRCFDELNLSNRDLIRQIHRNYIRAGADIIETNTFGANRLKLGKHALESRLAEIIRAGVEIAREAVEQEKVYVAGSVGPLGAPLGAEVPETLAREVFAEQIGELIGAGVDLLVFETFADPYELALALEVLRGLDPRFPVAAFAVFDEQGLARGELSPEQTVRLLEPFAPTVVGANCRLGAEAMLPVLARMREATALPLGMMPNSGAHRVVEDRDMYLSTPEFMAEYARRAIQTSGVRLVGGCCGTTPQHIRAISAMVRMLRPGQVVVGRDLSEGERENLVETINWSEKTPFARKLAAGKFVSSVEIRSPRGTDLEKIELAMRGLAEGGADAMNIPDGPRAAARMNPGAVATVLKREGLDIELIVHYVCRDRNLLGIQADLLGMHCLGLRNVLAVTGDPPKLGDYPDATAVYDVDAIGLVAIIKRLNCGMDLAGTPLGSHTQYLIGVGANPGALNLEEEVRRLWAKIENGAEYVFTQPVYDPRILERFLDRMGKLPVPLLAGLYPLYSFKNAEFLHNEVPGMTIPEDIRLRMKEAGSGPKAQDTGVAIAREALAEVKSRVQGAYIMPPFDKWELALRVLDGFIVKEKPQAAKADSC